MQLPKKLFCGHDCEETVWGINFAGRNQLGNTLLIFTVLRRN